MSREIVCFNKPADVRANSQYFVKIFEPPRVRFLASIVNATRDISGLSAAINFQRGNGFQI